MAIFPSRCINRNLPRLWISGREGTKPSRSDLVHTWSRSWIRQSSRRLRNRPPHPLVDLSRKVGGCYGLLLVCLSAVLSEVSANRIRWSSIPPAATKILISPDPSSEVFEQVLLL